MHNAALRAMGLDAVYLPLETADPDDLLSFAGAIGLEGASITAPLKVALTGRLDRVEGAAARLGAVNTIRRDGSLWRGTNTDIEGFLAPLARRTDLAGTRAAVFGAGGAARAAAFALRSAGAAVSVFARRLDRAREVAALVNGQAGTGFPPRGSWDVLVNATPVGTWPGDGEESPALARDLAGGRLVYDLVYLAARLAEMGLDRQGTIVAVGGGVVGDVAGFDRGNVHARRPVGQRPDHAAGHGGREHWRKGRCECWRGEEPRRALPPCGSRRGGSPDAGDAARAERTSGMAEAIKHGIVAGGALYDDLERAVSFGTLPEIAAALRVKARIVSSDPFERGSRAALNLGHTIGHGIEAASGYGVRHGEAVAVGLVAEARLAEAIGLASAGLADRIATVVGRHGLPASWHGAPWQQVRASMDADKKKDGGGLALTLPAAIGDVRVGVKVEEEVLTRELQALSRPPGAAPAWTCASARLRQAT